MKMPFIRSKSARRAAILLIATLITILLWGAYGAIPASLVLVSAIHLFTLSHLKDTERDLRSALVELAEARASADAERETLACKIDLMISCLPFDEIID